MQAQFRLLPGREQPYTWGGIVTRQSLADLVGALKHARQRRQVIVVTHNADLAIVGDADQIVHCRHEGGRFLLNSGTLAQASTGEESINVLEGARPAFDNRKSKYDTVVPKAD